MNCIRQRYKKSRRVFVGGDDRVFDLGGRGHDAAADHDLGGHPSGGGCVGIVSEHPASGHHSCGVGGRA